MYRTCKCLWGAPTNWDSSPQVGYMSSDVGVPFLVGLILIDTWEHPLPCVYLDETH